MPVINKFLKTASLANIIIVLSATTKKDIGGILLKIYKDSRD
jgi:hypothetical protein